MHMSIFPTGGLCDFQVGYCSFKQDSSDDLDWKRAKGSTPTTGTGPTVDHTLGSSLGEKMNINVL